MNKVSVHTFIPETNKFGPVGIFEVDEAGVAQLSILDERFEASLRKFALGVDPTIAPCALVLPSEGSKYLDALSMKCERMSYWTIRDESAGARGAA